MYGGTYSLRFESSGSGSSGQGFITIRFPFPTHADVPAGPDASFSFFWKRADHEREGRYHTVFLLDDDDGDGEHGPEDDTFRYRLPNNSFETDDWEVVSIPLNDFMHADGTQGVFDPEVDGNGGLVGICLEAETYPGGSLRLYFDYLILSEGTFTSTEEVGPSGSPSLSIFPNPTGHLGVSPLVTYRQPNAAAVAIRVLDVRGREVARLHEGPLPAGESRLLVGAPALASGTYFVVVTGEHGVETVPFTVTH